MITTIVAERAALLVAGRSELHDLESLLRGMGYLPVPVDSAERVQSVQEKVALCIIDLRQNGEALRTARAVRAQHPQAVVIGIADPDRPTASADAIRAGVFDVLPRPPSARDLEALIANAREQAALASSAPHDPHHRHGVLRHRRHLARDAAGHGPGAAGRGRPLRHPDLRRARHAGAR